MNNPLDNIIDEFEEEDVWPEEQAARDHMERQFHIACLRRSRIFGPNPRILVGVRWVYLKFHDNRSGQEVKDAFFAACKETLERRRKGSYWGFT